MDKRFVQLDKGLDFTIKDNLTGKLLTDNGSCEQMLNILDREINKLQEENLQLKRQLELKSVIERENKELRGKMSNWKITASEEITEKQILMMKLHKCEQENQMLKNTIARNECYIAKLTNTGEWSR